MYDCFLNSIIIISHSENSNTATKYQIPIAIGIKDSLIVCYTYFPSPRDVPLGLCVLVTFFIYWHLWWLYGSN